MTGEGRGGKRILLVDDSPVVADVVRDALEPFGYQVSWIEDGDQVPLALKRGFPDLIILDVMMPGVDGYQVCRDLRADSATADLPILMLTARAEEVDRVIGLELGADDYVPKPFGERELLARVRALLRRVARSSASEQVLRAGPVSVDLDRHQASCAGVLLDLTPTEYALLHLLVLNRGRVLSRETLLNQVWGYDWYGNDRVVDTHVQHLRGKLSQCLSQDEADRELILTVRGVGYRFADYE
jgi:two-component system alkaline phosphatase synthesis response regulator PhoP